MLLLLHARLDCYSTGHFSLVALSSVVAFLQLLPQCDKIAIMDGGKMVYFGPFNMAAINQFMPSSTNHLLEAEANKKPTAPVEEPRKSIDKRVPRSATHMEGVVIPGEEASGATGYRIPMIESMGLWWKEGSVILGCISLCMYYFPLLALHCATSPICLVEVVLVLSLL